MGFVRHFTLLLWKNFLLQLRHPWVTFFEIILPCFFIAMIASIRVLVKVTHYENSTYYESFDIYHVPNITDSNTFNILFAPDYSPFDQVMKNVKDSLDELNWEDAFPRRYDFKVQGFQNEGQLVNHYLQETENLILCGVVFENTTDNTKNLKFKLRFKSSPTHQLGEGQPVKSWTTQNTFPQFSLPGPRQRNHSTGGQPGYYEEGFLTIQHLVSMAFLNITTNGKSESSFDDIQVVAQRFPYPPYIDDGFLVALQFLFPIILMFSFIYTPCNLTKNLVLEKEKRLKESMKMMGLKEWMHWLAWLTKYVIWMAITVALMTILLCIKLRDGVGILNRSDWSLVFVFFFLYGINTIAFSFLVSTIFSKANVAGVGTGVLFFLTFMPYFTAATRYLDISLAQKLLTGLLHNTNMAFGAIVIAMWEGNNVGIKWSNLSETASPDDNLTLLNVIVMFIVDTIIYFLVTWYISSAFPGEYGIPLKWYFPFTKSYWCTSNFSDDDMGVVNNGFDLHARDEIDMENKLNSSYFESEPKTMPKGIQIKGLSKTFDSGDTFAVKNLNLTTYSGQITALLGHNGAGKTTTMSILTGLFPPSSGTAIVNGYDIRANMENIRSSLGICPQFDVLFDELTVEEHLRFFCRLKNVTDPEVIEEEITNMIELLALTDKRKAQSQTLSGGMKRKLSVGIALIGGSKIVILDEPTSGMDVSARRFIWDLLLEMKENRTILLSTHFMEEADVLGDRIAIMANGKLQCCGSPLFLKKKYGAGYHLTISKKKSATDVYPITRLIQTHIPNAKLETSGGTELAYSLPNEDTSRFEALFAEIEENQHQLEIDSYGASITTMEEVFLKVGEYAEEGIKAINENKNGMHSTPDHSYLPIDSTDKSNGDSPRNTGTSLIIQQFYGLIMKKILYGWRNPFLTASQFLLPVLFTISSILISKSNPKPSDSPALDLNLGHFKGTSIPYFYDSQTESLATNYYKLMDAQNKGEGVSASVTNLTDYAINYLDESAQKDLSHYSLHQPIGAIFEMDNLTNNANVTALFNNQAYHTPGIALAFIDSAIMKNVLNESDFNLNVVNHPLPRTANEILLAAQYQSQDQFQTAQNLMFSMSFLAASFAILLVRERVIKGKHLQIVCGVKLPIFWTASFIVDFFTYIIPCLLVMLMYKAFNLDHLSSGDQESRILLTFLVHGFAMLPFVYVLSFLFDTPSTAYVRICIYNVILGIGTFLAVIITELPALEVVYISKPLNTIFSLFLPNYCLGRSIYNLYNNDIGNEICNTPRQIPIKKINYIFNGSLVKFCNFVCTFAHAETQNSQFKSIQTCCKDNDCVDPDASFPWEKNYLSTESPGIGSMLLSLCFQTVFYWILIILTEYNVFRKLRYFYYNCGQSPTNTGPEGNQRAEEMDEDVINESKRLEFTELDKLAEENALVIKNLSKNYGAFCAVDNISYGVRKGECFGLLGVNGAGKTTTFKMITGDEPISSGDIFVNGFDIKRNIQTVQRQIGYCPQFDGLLDQLTGKETLTLFSRLRGIKEEDIPNLIVEISRLLYFDMHIDKQVGKYSGGTKRKLSTAVALLGSPSVSFLDEPTTGVDPVARRCLWDALTKKLYEGSSIVLTSHSMEECEALCNRLIIMVNGRICCIGSPQHLKNKFGKGYTIQIKVSSTESRERNASILGRQFSRQTSTQSQIRRSSLDSTKVSQFVYQRQASEMITAQNTTDVKEFMSTAFPGCQLKAVHNNLLEYSINDDKITWSQIFGRIERAKNRVNIEDYSIGQTTLEQIFLSFARKQRESSD